MGFYDIYDALIYRATKLCGFATPFEPALILPKGDGLVVWGMKRKDNVFFFEAKQRTLPVKGIAPVKKLPNNFERYKLTLDFDFPLSTEMQIDFIKRLQQIEENRETLWLCENEYGIAIANILNKDNSIEELLIDWHLAR